MDHRFCHAGNKSIMCLSILPIIIQFMATRRQIKIGILVCLTFNLHGITAITFGLRQPTCTTKLCKQRVNCECSCLDKNYYAHGVHAMHGVYGSAYAYCDNLPILICCLAGAREVGWVGVATLLAGDCCCDESASLSSEGSWSLFYYT